MKRLVVTGGSGFIGAHLIPHLRERWPDAEISNFDRRRGPPGAEWARADITCDLGEIPENADAIVHLAAVSRDPGPPPPEYYKVNAEATSALLEIAARKGIRRIILFSSIAVFGATEDEADEFYPHRPDTPYGMSKALAEVHAERWADADESRRVAIVRPGIVFGPGDPGNFGRMLRAVRRGWFIIPGRSDTKKAAVYVRDLVRLVAWLLESNSPPPRVNAVYPNTPEFAELVAEVQRHVAPQRRRSTPVLPTGILRPGVRALSVLEASKPADDRIFHPRRVDKLVHSTNVVSTVLPTVDFKFEWNWSTAVADWLRHEAAP